MKTSGKFWLGGERWTGRDITGGAGETRDGGKQHQEQDANGWSAAGMFHSVEILRFAQHDTRPQKGNLVTGKNDACFQNTDTRRLASLHFVFIQNKPGRNLGLPAIAAR